MLRQLPAHAVLLALFLGAGLPARAGSADFDPARVLGRWQVVGRTEAALEQDACRAPEFARTTDGLWSRRCVDPPEPDMPMDVSADDPRRWTVSTGLLTSRELRLLYLSADARFAALGGDGPRVLILLAREPTIPDWHYAGLVARSALQGYDVGALKKEGPAQGRP